LPKGDFDWAVGELQSDLGKAWANDKFGHTLLHMALYEGRNSGFALSPDLQHAAYESFAGLNDSSGNHIPGTGYMDTEYGYDFEENFDWDAYREWYDKQ
jgi:hypothetical protein